MAEPFIVIELPGPPRGKGRHRSRIGYKAGKAFVMQYPDPETVKYEKALADVAIEAMNGKALLHEAVSVLVEALVPIPVSFSKKKHAAAITGEIARVEKPDGDNYLKIVDALNKIVWNDDSQVVLAQVHKFYSETPMLRVSVWRWFETRAPSEPTELFPEG